MAQQPTAYLLALLLCMKMRQVLHARLNRSWLEYYAGDKNAIEGAHKLCKIRSMKEISPKSELNFWKDDLEI